MCKLSCGHIVNDLYGEYLLALGEEYCDYEGYKPCISYGSYCKECYDKLVQDPESIILYSSEEEAEYLQYPERFPKGVTK